MQDRRSEGKALIFGSFATLRSNTSSDAANAAVADAGGL
jgi:hypothetical protein